MSKPSKKETNKILNQGQAKAGLSSLRTSPRKLNLVAATIRKQNVNDALVQLTFSKRRIAKDVKKCLQSAIANAENNHSLDVNRLFVHEVMVGQGLVMKRLVCRARGRAAKIKKPFSNITITVKEYAESEE